MGKYKIFFSYTMRGNEVDKELLVKLKEILNGLDNIETYFDILDNHAIDHQKYVYKTLEKADALCLLKTANINKSQWVNKELNIAKKRQLPIIELDKNDIDRILCRKTKDELYSIEKVKELIKYSRKQRD